MNDIQSDEASDKQPTKTKRIDIMVAAGLFATLASIPTCYAWRNNQDYAVGNCVGVINDLSKQGTFYKTFECQMALEGLVSEGNTTSANVRSFSLDSQARHGENLSHLYQMLNQALNSGRKVKLSYIEASSTWSWRSSTRCLIQNVEYLDAQNSNEKK